MLDLISGGRIISGFVRGTGIEQLSTNANPAYNRERFEEAFALIKKTWTVPGPFRWEGKHYHLRVANHISAAVITPADQGHDRADRQSATDSRQSGAGRRGDCDARPDFGRAHHL